MYRDSHARERRQAVDEGDRLVACGLNCQLTDFAMFVEQRHEAVAPRPEPRSAPESRLPLTPFVAQPAAETVVSRE